MTEKLVGFSFKLWESELDDLRLLCEQTGRSLTTELRFALFEHLRKGVRPMPQGFAQIPIGKRDKPHRR